MQFSFMSVGNSNNRVRGL